MRSILVPLLVVLSGCISAENEPPAAESASKPPKEAQPVKEPAEQPDRPSAMTHRLVKEGTYGAAASGDVERPSRRAPFVEVARDEAQYRALWTEHIGSGEPSPVDWKTESVAFLLMPPQPTGGYAVKLRDASLDGSTVQVMADLIEPAEGAMVTQAFTAPFAIVAVTNRVFDRVHWINQGRLLARREMSAE